MARPSNDRLKVPSGTSVYIGTQPPTTEPPAPAPAPTLTLSASGTATAGASFGVTLTAANLTALLPTFPERVSGPALTFLPNTVNPAPGELVKLFNVVADAAGTAKIRAVASGAVSNELSFTVVAAPAPSPVTGTYRNNQALLFQATDSASRASTLGGSAYAADKWGPNSTYVCFQTGWAWIHAGGDGVDAALQPQGSTAWGQVDTPTGTAGVVYDHSIDATLAVQRVQTTGTWCAFRLDGSAAPRKIAGTFWPDATKRPRIAVTYTDGTTATLVCNLVAYIGSGTSPQTATPDIQLPAFIEFAKPAKPVANALMQFSCTEQQWSGTPNAIKLSWVLTPPTAVQPVQQGLASAGQPLDADLATNPNILGVHRYVDGAALTSFVVDESNPTTGKNIESEQHYDPAIWGGASDTSKWPHTAENKFVKGIQQAGQVNTNPQLLTSTQLAALGVTPLAPGLGALRVTMEALSVSTGQEVTDNGRLLLDMRLMFPEPLFGKNVPRLFVRYYEWQRRPAALFPADRKEVLSNGVIRWTDMAGKTGIGASHQNSYGGNSAGGGSGGNRGYQFRDSFLQQDTDMPGPLTGGEVRGIHWYDWIDYQPTGHKYGVEPGVQWERWGQLGGLGGVVYVNRWVCIEKEVKFNTAESGSYLADGEVRAWVDGRKVYERTGLVLRQLPVYNPGYLSSKLRPCRDLLPTGLWWNEFHGGQSELTAPRDIIRTGLAWGREYIGPMNLNTANAAWSSWTALTLPAKPTAGTITKLGSANMNTITSDTDERFMFGKIWDSWATGAKIELRNSAGELVDVRLYFTGGGHASTGWDGLIYWSLRKHLAGEYPFVYVHGASPAIAATTPVRYGWLNAQDPTYGENTLANGDKVPASHHPYAGLIGFNDNEPGGANLVLTRSTAVMVGGSPIPIGQGHHLSVATGKWERSGPLHPATSSTVHMTLRDRVRQRLVRMPANGATDVYTASYASGDWANLVWTLGATAARTSYGWSDNNEPSGVHHEPTDLYLTWAGNGQIRAFQPDNLAAATTVLNTSGLILPTMPAGKKGVGLHIRGTTGEVWILDMTTAPPTGFYALTPPASLPLSNPWVVTRRAFTGSSCLTASTGTAGNVGTFDIPQYFAPWDAWLIWGANNQPIEVWSC